MSAMTADISTLQPQVKSPYAMSASVEDGRVVSGGTGGITGAGTEDVSQEDFLLLLVTQLQNQDPLSPMDNMQFVSQLAQFRQIESTNNVENSIEDLNTSFDGTVEAQQSSASAIHNASAVSMIGKVVRLREESVSWDWDSTEPVPIKVNLGSAQDAMIEITDDDGTVIKTLQTGEKLNDSSAVAYWDGTQNNGEAVTPGTYSVHIVGSEDNSDLYAFVQDTVVGLRYTENGALLKIAGKELALENIMDVAMGESTKKYGGLGAESALGMLDKSVTLYQTHVSRPPLGDAVTFNVNMGTESSTKVHLVDSGGNIVRELDIVAGGNGIGTVVWDGTQNNGQTPVAEGEYEIHFANEEEKPWIFAFTKGMVEGVSGSEGMTLVKVNGAYFPVTQILEIESPSAAYSQQNTGV